jgi:hypothetical protein
MKSRARETFQAFHKRNAGAPVFPFESMPVGEFNIAAKLPDFVLLGRAVRTCYTSDKWNEVGDVVGYYHDHGPADGAHATTLKNKTEFYAPHEFFPKERVAKFPVKWPAELVLLGECDEWFVQRHDGDKSFTKGKCDGDVLLCSPYGWLSSVAPTRVFLVILEIDSGIVEGLILGPDLHVTEAGIEG